MAKTICAWCGDLLKAGSGPVSHGICPSCAASLLSEQRTNLPRYLDLFDEPIALVDREVTVLAAGRGLGRFVNRDPGELNEMKPGEMLECVHAFETGTCGSSVSCESCRLRALVRETFETGATVVRAPATVSRRSGEELRLSVTTEKIGGAVLLKLEAPGTKRSRKAATSP